MMSPDCEHVLERLSPFLDRELPVGEAGDIRTHIAGCRPCNGAHLRLERLEALSVRLLRDGTPAVAPAEWGARWTRIDGASLNPRVIALRERRERAARTTLARFALAAAVLVAATLALPLLLGSIGGDHLGHLCFSSAPGANEAEVIEVNGDVDRYSIGVDYPGSDSNDPVVINISKL